MKQRTISRGCLCLILAFLVLVPAACAIVENREIPASIDPPERDSPANIAALKQHAAYIGGSQQARMDGVIAYIETLGGSDNSERLRRVQNDYMAAAASIPAVGTADQIGDLRDEMRVQSGRFEEETHARLLFLNGTAEGVQEYVNISLTAFDLSMKDMTDPFWLSKTSARLVVFDHESRERNFTMRNLAEAGVDVRDARALAGGIDEMRPKFEAVVQQNNRYGTIFSLNSEVKSLNQKYRNTIDGYHENLKNR
jgi:ribosomal protein L13E